MQSTKDFHLPNSHTRIIHLCLSPTNWQRISIILVNGFVVKGTVSANFIFLIKVHTMVNSSMTEQRVLVVYSIPTEIFILDSGKTIKLTERANILQQTEPHMMDSGFRINALEEDNNSGQMEQFLQDFMVTIRKTEEESLSGQTETTTKGISKIIANPDKEL